MQSTIGKRCDCECHDDTFAVVARFEPDRIGAHACCADAVGLKAVRSVDKCISPRAVCDVHDLPRYVGEVARAMVLAMQHHGVIRGGLRLRLEETRVMSPPTDAVDLHAADTGKPSTRV